jgi:hypothetical protein
MKQNLAFPHRPVRRSGSSLPVLGRTTTPDRFTLQVRLRGQMGPTCEAACAGLEEAIQWGAAHFPAFAERNPWIGLDSLQRKIWILLDPETENLSK